MPILTIKKSSVVGREPTGLQPAELAVNLADEKLFTAKADGTVFELGGSGEGLWEEDGGSLTPTAEGLNLEIDGGISCTALQAIEDGSNDYVVLRGVSGQVITRTAGGVYALDVKNTSSGSTVASINGNGDAVFGGKVSANTYDLEALSPLPA